MKIVLIAQFAGSERLGMVYGHYYLAREWAASGHEVTIISSAYSHTRTQQPDTSDHKISEEFIDGIRYLWLPANKYDSASRWGRFLSIFLFSVQSRFRHLNIESADVVICSSHQPFPIYAARKLAQKFSARLVFEVRDIWPKTLIELGGLSPKNPIIRAMQKAEDFAYAHSDLVVSVLLGAKAHMIDRGMKEDKFTYIPNGLPSASSAALDCPREYLEQINELKRQGLFVLGYTGSLGQANDLDSLIRAISIAGESVGAVIVGHGPYKEKLHELSENLDISDRVLILDPIAKDAVKALIAQFDAAYVGLRAAKLYDYGTSLTKINDYIMSKRPIIFATGQSEKEYPGIFYCEPESPAAIAKVIVEVRSLSVNEQTRIGEILYDWAIKNRSYSKLASDFLEAVMR